MKKVKIYTDGACSGNPGPGGWGAVLLYGKNKKEISGNDKCTTNNRMELISVISALETLNQPCCVELYTDSKYVSNAINMGWLKTWQAKSWKRKGGDIKNPDLWVKLAALIEKHDVTFIWVKGHADNVYNNRCDELAVEARQKLLV